ncbi:High-affinity nickel-transporter [Nonomuraea aurantiaca]|uniref:High-affinity nickel-transporter n=1 Tax=Nonomuraea aurantiaca TaxID=2878562 RepID=UPI001CDA0EDC|nr:High-affinity nickel-transporter [Nonomuraea aurantiaca]MCA2224620.1 High-affinity nickel-transporter [Nonomuraea aurantiaca]
MIGVVAAAVILAAHPLGNLSVNHYDGLRVFLDRIEDTAIIDSAEIPTLQQRQNTSGPPDAYAARACGELADAVRGQVGERPLAWRVTSASFAYRPGAAGLPTSRLTCRLTAPLRVERPLTLTFANPYRGEAVGWREITAAGSGVRLSASSVPARSMSGELHAYPADLLSSPLDVRQARFTVEPGSGGLGTSARVPGADVLTRYTGLLADRLNSLVGADRLTVPLGLLALLVSLVLGAAHAALPGHGKTVMAAYLAGRDGGLRDALAVAATVTLTHTAGVIVLGVLLSVSASIAGAAVLGWLGVISGLLIAAIGAALLRSATVRPASHHGDADGHAVGKAHEHGHAHGHGRAHEHGHGHGHFAPSGRGVVGLGIAGGLVPSPSALVVLLGAMALGRTAFGIVTVVCYGLGMALTLLAAALTVRRLAGLTLTNRLTRLRPYTATITAALVLLVGTGIAVRALASLV